jgi:hypothetical protein
VARANRVHQNVIAVIASGRLTVNVAQQCIW